MNTLCRVIEDYFPSPMMSAFDTVANNLNDIVTEICDEMELQVGRSFVDKIQQLYDGLNNRIGVIILGSASSGKTTLYKVLAKIYSKMIGSVNEDGRVAYQVISPWSLPYKYLYAYYDSAKKCWNDGFITKSLRELSANTPVGPRWLVLDGVLHTDLVCQLHTLLDNNRKLTMPSGEILQVRFLILDC